MSYSTKYYTTFKDYFDRDILINFDFKDYSGESTELKAGIDAADIYQPENESNFFNPIIGSELKVTLISETNFQLTGLFVNNNKDAKVIVYRDEVVIWVGWLVPNQYFESYIAPPYPVTVTALDGLGLLKTYTWESDSWAAPISILGTILNKLELSIPLWESINIYDSSMDSGETDSMLNQCYFNQVNYKGLSYYDILQDILTGLGSEIKQINGEWKITRLSEVNNPLVKRRIDIALTGIGTDQQTETLTKFIGRSDSRDFANSDAELIGVPGWNKFNIYQDAGRFYGVKNHDFSGEYEDTAGGRIAVGWSASTGQFPDRAIVNKKKILKNTTFNLSTTYDNIIFQFVPGVTAINKFNGDMQFFNVRISLGVCKKVEYESDTILANQKVQVILMGSATYYLNKLGEWTLVPTFIEFQNMACNIPSQLNFYNFEIPKIQFPINGTLFLNIFSPYAVNSANRTKLDSWYVEEFSIDGYHENFGLYLNNGFLELPEYTGTSVNQNMSFIPDFDVQFKFSDYPDYKNTKLLYQNGLVSELVNFTVTKNWVKRGEIAIKNLYLHLVDDYIAHCNKNTYIIRGTILSQDLNFDSTIIDYQVSQKKYYCKGGTYNLRTCMLHGSFHEVGLANDSDWILKHGVWNDDGIWIDDEVWNDSDPDPAN